ncbi:MAG: MOSC domain-containing protein [Panacagrimonas sp.]
MSTAPTFIVRRIDGLYAGQVQPMPDDGRPTGIFKRLVEGSVRIRPEGLEGDAQGDRRVHGGIEKAVHQFAVSNYARLAEQFPERAQAFVPGAIGENLSTADLDESSVCIGDVFALGTARIQLNQPRTPCWKIDARFGLEGITAFVAKQGIAGWYYRVLEPGTVEIGDELRLLDRSAETLTLRQLHQLARTHRPPLDELLRAAKLPGLAPTWAEKFQARARWLRQNTPAAELPPRA